VVITEGNYLLLDAPEWRDVRELLDEVWFCEVDTQLRQQRLNAELIECTRSRADLVITCE